MLRDMITDYLIDENVDEITYVNASVMWDAYYGRASADPTDGINGAVTIMNTAISGVLSDFYDLYDATTDWSPSVIDSVVNTILVDHLSHEESASNINVIFLDLFGLFEILSEGVTPLFGDLTDNIINGTSADKTIQTHDGDDVIVADGGEDTIIAGGGNDNVTGGDGNDFIVGGWGDDTIDGGDGADTFLSGDGSDHYIGGSGVDTLDYSSASHGVEAYLNSGQATTISGVDALSEIENLIGSNSDDRLIGDENDNRLEGGAGNDIIKGKDGNDIFTVVLEMMKSAAAFTLTLCTVMKALIFYSD